MKQVVCVYIYASNAVRKGRVGRKAGTDKALTVDDEKMGNVKMRIFSMTDIVVIRSLTNTCDLLTFETRHVKQA